MGVACVRMQPLHLPVVALALALAVPGRGQTAVAKPPNVILCMADDQGWGDAGYAGHSVLQTPNLDAMASAGLRFTRFYAGAPVCSPTRGSCLTGRHPSRYGILGANHGHMRSREVTLAEVLRARGFATGHFGKWHLGTLTDNLLDSNRGGRAKGKGHYAPPWEHGFERCFSTEAKVPTWDPMRKPGTDERYGTAYWNERGQRVTDNLEGDDSRVIMDRVVPFVRDAARDGRPFFAVIWFHAPHKPALAGPKHLALYESEKNEERRHYYGCLSAMDEQIGRLRATLREVGVADDTMLWFCSDNGPEGRNDQAPGSAGPLRGRKRSLYEGGVRVPALLEWPARVDRARTVETPCSTSDYFPTVLDVLGEVRPNPEEPLDGVSLLPWIDGGEAERARPIGFASRQQLALVEHRFKLYSRDSGGTWQLYDVIADPAESQDLAADEPEIVARMAKTLDVWRISCAASRQAKDD